MYGNEMYDKNVGKEIGFVLYNFYKIDEIIEDKKEEIIYNTNKGLVTWLRRKDDAVEQAVYRIEINKNINRLIIWKQVISSVIKDLKVANSKIYFFINYKYFRKLEKEEICEKMVIDENEYRQLKVKAKNIVYMSAIKNNLYKLETV